METFKVRQVVSLERPTQFEDAEIDKETLEIALMESQSWDFLETYTEIYEHEEMGSYAKDSSTWKKKIDASNIILYEGHFFGVIVEGSDYLLIKEWNKSVDGGTDLISSGSRSETYGETSYTLKGHESRVSYPFLVSLDGKTVLGYLSKEKEVVIPDGIEEIGKSIFEESKTLEAIRFPSSLKRIGNKAFSYCHLLKEIDIPCGCEIGDNAYRGCESLSIARLSKGCKIGEFAFAFCLGLKEIAIPEDCEIGERAFMGSGIENVAFLDAGVKLGIKPFQDTPYEKIYEARKIDMQIERALALEGKEQFDAFIDLMDSYESLSEENKELVERMAALNALERYFKEDYPKAILKDFDAFASRLSLKEGVIEYGYYPDSWSGIERKRFDFLPTVGPYAFDGEQLILKEKNKIAHPIRWRILDYSKGIATAISESFLDPELERQVAIGDQAKDADDFLKAFSEGREKEANAAPTSGPRYIKSYLNGAFFEKAFPDGGKFLLRLKESQFKVSLIPYLDAYSPWHFLDYRNCPMPTPLVAPSGRADEAYTYLSFCNDGANVDLVYPGPTRDEFTGRDKPKQSFYLRPLIRIDLSSLGVDKLWELEELFVIKRRYEKLSSSYKVEDDMLYFGLYPQEEFAPSSEEEKRKLEALPKINGLHLFDGDALFYSGATRCYYRLSPIKWKILEKDKRKLRCVTDTPLDTSFFLDKSIFGFVSDYVHSSFIDKWAACFFALALLDKSRLCKLNAIGDYVEVIEKGKYEEAKDRFMSLCEKGYPKFYAIIDFMLPEGK